MGGLLDIDGTNYRVDMTAEKALGFDEWKQKMFRKAVDEGFSEYKKYLTA